MEEDEVVEDIDENYSDEDFERGEDALLNSSILDSKPKPVRNAEGGGKTLSSGNKQTNSKDGLKRNSDQKLPEDALF